MLRSREFNIALYQISQINNQMIHIPVWLYILYKRIQASLLKTIHQAMLNCVIMDLNKFLKRSNNDETFYRKKGKKHEEQKTSSSSSSVTIHHIARECIHEMHIEIQIRYAVCNETRNYKHRPYNNNNKSKRPRHIQSTMSIQIYIFRLL